MEVEKVKDIDNAEKDVEGSIEDSVEKSLESNDKNDIIDTLKEIIIKQNKSMITINKALLCILMNDIVVSDVNVYDKEVNIMKLLKN